MHLLTLADLSGILRPAKLQAMLTKLQNAMLMTTQLTFRSMIM